MTKDEALQLALEALEEIHRGNMTPMAEESWEVAIADIKEALAEKQEPVAYVMGYYGGRCVIDSPKIDPATFPAGMALYTTPPQRGWIGLSKADTEGLWGSQLALVKAIETKLKEKNT